MMNEFFILYNDEYKAISFDKNYLYLEYNKIKNLIVKFVKEGKISPKFKGILANPEVKSINGKNAIIWSSEFVGLKKFQDSPSETAYSLFEDFKVELNNILKDFENAKDENLNNWFHILSLVFEEQNCILFHNDDNICLIWGWEFENNINYRQNFPKKKILTSTIEPLVNQSQIQDDFSKEIPVELIDNKIEEAEEPKREEPEVDEQNVLEESEESEEEIIEEIIRESPPVAENGFWRFLRWFAGRFWWLLFVILFIIALLLLFNNCEKDNKLRDVQNRMEELDAKFSNCNNN